MGHRVLGGALASYTPSCIVVCVLTPVSHRQHKFFLLPTDISVALHCQHFTGCPSFGHLRLTTASGEHHTGSTVCCVLQFVSCQRCSDPHARTFVLASA